MPPDRHPASVVLSAPDSARIQQLGYAAALVAGAEIPELSQESEKQHPPRNEKHGQSEWVFPSWFPAIPACNGHTTPSNIGKVLVVDGGRHAQLI